MLGSVLIGGFIVLVEGILLEESLFGHIFLEIVHVQRTQNLFDINFGQIFDIVAWCNVVGQVDWIQRTDIVYFTSWSASLQEVEHVIWSANSLLEKLYEIQLSQTFIFLDGGSQSLGNGCHFEVKWEKFLKIFLEILVQSGTFGVCTNEHALGKGFVAFWCS